MDSYSDPGARLGGFVPYWHGFGGELFSLCPLLTRCITRLATPKFAPNLFCKTTHILITASPL